MSYWTKRRKVNKQLERMKLELYQQIVKQNLLNICNQNIQLSLIIHCLMMVLLVLMMCLFYLVLIMPLLSILIKVLLAAKKLMIAL